VCLSKQNTPHQQKQQTTKHHHHKQINMSIFNVGPVLVSLAAFGVYAARGYALTAAVAFPALALFNLLRFPIVMIPQQVRGVVLFVMFVYVGLFVGGGEVLGVNQSLLMVF
jgi:hypothetical protein